MVAAFQDCGLKFKLPPFAPIIDCLSSSVSAAGCLECCWLPLVLLAAFALPQYRSQWCGRWSPFVQMLVVVVVVVGATVAVRVEEYQWW